VEDVCHFDTQKALHRGISVHCTPACELWCLIRDAMYLCRNRRFSTVHRDCVLCPSCIRTLHTIERNPNTRLWETNWWMNVIQWMWLISMSFIIIWGSRWTRVRELNASHVVTWPTEVHCARSILLSLAPWNPTPTWGHINPSHLTSDVRCSTYKAQYKSQLPKHYKRTQDTVLHAWQIVFFVTLSAKDHDLSCKQDSLCHQHVIFVIVHSYNCHCPSRHSTRGQSRVASCTFCSAAIMFQKEHIPVRCWKGDLTTVLHSSWAL
jgi:hypothetical protein